MPLPLPTQAAQLEERLASSSALRELSYKADLEKRLTAFLAQPRGHMWPPTHPRRHPTPLPGAPLLARGCLLGPRGERTRGN